MKKLVATGLVAGLLLVGGPATSHKIKYKQGGRKESINVQGTAFCAEDARLVPIKPHGYMPERVSGWVYTCRNFDKPGKWSHDTTNHGKHCRDGQVKKCDGE